MPPRPVSSLSLGLVLLLAASLLACPARAREPYPLAPTRAELAARPALAAALARVRTLEAKLQVQVVKLAALRGETGRLAEERKHVDRGMAVLTDRLKDLLARLWDADVRLRGVMDAQVSPWAESERERTWLEYAYAKARRDLEGLRIKRDEISARQARQAALDPEAVVLAGQVEQTKDALLAERLKLLRRLEALRQDNPEPGPRLERILEQASLADFSPLCAVDKPLESARGSMPWPAKGLVVSGFDPQASPPRNGVGLACAPGAKVAAAHWGRVAFADQVPGLGRVVVVAHGGGFLSVYACLSAVVVKPGQEVARGEEIGTVGGYPPAKGSGTSFELRFGLKPINPSRWLLTG